MAVKSIIDVEVNDEAFKDFSKLFEKYSSALAGTPGHWAKAEAAATGTTLTVESLIAGLLTQQAIQRKVLLDEEKHRKELEKERLELEKQKRLRDQAAKSGLGLSVAFRDVSKSILASTAALAKWGTYIGAVSGVVGYGSLFGIDKLANDVGQGRRYASGIGSTYGEAKGFVNAYSPVLDNPQGLLEGVNQALSDPSKRSVLYGAGLTAGQVNNKDSVKVAEDLIPALKKIADATSYQNLGAVARARGIDQLISLDEFKRIKSANPTELREIRSAAGERAKQANVNDAVAKKWQALGIQLDFAKTKIETVLVNKLGGLADPLGKLSESVTKAIDNFLSGIDDKTIKDISKGIEDLGKYLGSPKFRTDIKTFSDDVSYAAEKIATALKWLHLIPDTTPAPDGGTPVASNKHPIAGAAAGALLGGIVGGPLGAIAGGAIGAVGGNLDIKRPGLNLRDVLAPFNRRILGEQARWTPSPNDSNPGNLRVPGINQGFAMFEGGADAGVRAIARQIKLYENRDHLDTIEKIIATYAPKKDKNNVEAYVKDVEHYTGIKRDAKLDRNDEDQVAKIVAGITRHEGRKAYAKHQVDIIIQNNTGGSAIVQSNQAAKQG